LVGVSGGEVKRGGRNGGVAGMVGWDVTGRLYFTSGQGLNCSPWDIGSRVSGEIYTPIEDGTGMVHMYSEIGARRRLGPHGDISTRPGLSGSAGWAPMCPWQLHGMVCSPYC